MVAALGAALIALNWTRSYWGAANEPLAEPVASRHRQTPEGNRVIRRDATEPASPDSAWNDLASWADQMTAGRPSSYQQALDAPPEQDIRFGTPIRMRAIEDPELTNDSFLQQSPPIRQIEINGEVLTESQIEYVRGEGQIVVCALRGKGIDVRVIDLQPEGNAVSLGALPKLNFNESRRWWIPDWYKISDFVFLGHSCEEDAKSEGIIMSHFYLYDLKSKTLSTLLLPSEISPYQQIALTGIDPGKRQIGIATDAGGAFRLEF